MTILQSQSLEVVTIVIVINVVIGGFSGEDQRLLHISQFFVSRQKFFTCRAISDSVDLKKSCWALLTSVQWTKTICRGSHVPQPMRNCYESHVNKFLFQHGGIDSALSLNAVSCDRKSARVWQADVPTNFYLI